MALPLGRAAVRAGQAGAWHGQCGRPEGAGELARAMAMPMTDRRRRGVVLSRAAPAIAWTRQDRRQLLLDQRLDKAAHLGAQTRLDRIEPVVEKLASASPQAGFVVMLSMAWSPVRRTNAGITGF